MNPRPEQPPIVLPWFIDMDGPRPRLRWRPLLTRFFLVVGLQVLVILAINYWSVGRIRAARVGAVVLPLSVMMVLIVHRNYRRAFPDQQQLARGQLSLFALLALVSAFCVWLALIRFDDQWERNRYAQRQNLLEQLREIVGNGRVDWSGNQPTLFLAVKRQDFGDVDLERVTRLVRSAAPHGGGIYFLDLSSTSVTDQGLRCLSAHGELEYLFLDSCAVSDQGLRAVQGLPELKVLSVRKTQVTQAWIDQMRARRPGLSVEPKHVEVLE